MPNERQQQKRRVFVELLNNLRTLSTCKRYKHAAVVIDPRMRAIHAIGYNGVPARIDHRCCSKAEDPCVCTHAEANALVKLQSLDRDLIMLVTTHPCVKCAGLIINSDRIATVVCGSEASASKTQFVANALLMNANIQIVPLSRWLEGV